VSEADETNPEPGTGSAPAAEGAALPYVSPVATPSRSRAAMVYAGKGFVAACVFFVTLRLASYLMQESHGNISLPMAIIVLIFAVMALLLAGALAHAILYWRMPLQKLNKLIDDIASSRAPLEDLKKVERGATSLTEPLTRVFQQLKTAQAEIRQLNAEIRQRVATRTESLERKLGVMQLKAARDALTGLLNRRALEEALPQMIETCRRSRREMVVMMIDVDYFKVLNDTLGHQAGDDLLRSIGQIIRSTLRETDTAYRYGGDEFVVLMPGADLVAGKALSTRLRQMIDALGKSLPSLPKRPQLSIGLGTLDELPAGSDPQQLLAWADQRLYAIKHARKDAIRAA
jgi:diguanylate cyclase (GGDEF)-like protein